MVSILCLESEINDFRELNKKIEVHVFANVKVADQNLCPRIFSTRYRKLIDKHDIPNNEQPPFNVCTAMFYQFKKKQLDFRIS